MFVKNFDPDDPRWAHWNLKHLEPLTSKQNEAFWDDDEIDMTPITVKEQIELCTKYECKVNMTFSNMCKSIERKWPKVYFNKHTFDELTHREKEKLRYNMVKHAVRIYNKTIDLTKMKRRVVQQNAAIFAPFWEERFLRHRFQRIKKIGEDERAEQSEFDRNSMDSNSNFFDTSSSQTVIPSGQHQLSPISLPNLSQNSIESQSKNVSQSNQSVFDSLNPVPKSFCKIRNKQSSNNDIAENLVTSSEGDEITSGPEFEHEVEIGDTPQMNPESQPMSEGIEIDVVHFDTVCDPDDSDFDGLIYFPTSTQNLRFRF